MWTIAVMIVSISGAPQGSFTYVPDKWTSQAECEAFRDSEPFKLALKDFMEKAKEFMAKKDMTEELVALTRCTAKGTDA